MKVLTLVLFLVMLASIILVFGAAKVSAPLAIVFVLIVGAASVLLDKTDLYK